MTERVLRLALPNKGRLMEPSVTLLRDAGLSFETTDRALSVRIRNVDLDLLFVRTEDIAEMVQDGVADLGITGQDLLAETGAALETLVELDYGRCRLVAAVPAGSVAEKIDDLAGTKVATAHPRVTASFFAEREIDLTIIPLRGSVEVAPKLGVADAIVDLVSSGSTLLINGLRELETILPSQAALVASPLSMSTRQSACGQVATVLKAVVAGRRKRYLLLNSPVSAVERITAIIPGLEAPTVVPLAEEGWMAIHSVVDAGELWDLLPRLESAGGRGILVLRIEQLIP
jgi:ATP phosphoribosyltransferase